MIQDARRDAALLDELEHLARCLGHDPAARRAAAARLSRPTSSGSSPPPRPQP